MMSPEEFISSFDSKDLLELRRNDLDDDLPTEPPFYLGVTGNPPFSMPA
jgi:hypothetical protein